MTEQVDNKIEERKSKTESILTDEDVWLRAWCEVSSADNCFKPSTSDTWADHCLTQFRFRFRK